MSSYLNIYVKPKTKDSKPLLLTSFSRSSDVYQQFNEEFDLYSSTGELKEITDSMMNTLENNLAKEINQCKNRYCTYLEAKDKADIEDITSIKEYIYDLEYCKTQIAFIQDIVWSCESDNSDFEKVLAYID